DGNSGSDVSQTPAQIGAEYQRTTVRCQFEDECVNTTFRAALKRALSREVCACSSSCYVHVQRSVNCNGVAAVIASPANVGRINKAGPIRRNFTYKNVVAAFIACLVGTCRLRKICGLRLPGHIHIPTAVDRDAVRIILSTSAEIGRVAQRW